MGSSVPNSPKMLARLWAARPQRLPAALSVLVLIISLYLDISGPALWLTVAIIKRVASLVAFVALFAGTFTGLVVSKVNITRILENSRNWEALKGQESLRTARAAPDTTPRPEFVTPSSLAGLDLAPADILFQNWSVPYEISAEFGRLVELCMRDFVSGWYPNLCKDNRPYLHLRSLMTHALGALCGHAGNVRFAMFLCGDVCEALRYHLHWYSEMSNRAARARPGAFRTTAPGSREQEQQLQLLRQRLILRQYMDANVLHPAADARNCTLYGLTPYEAESTAPDVDVALAAELGYLRLISQQLVPRLLPECERSSVVNAVFLKEMVANLILQPAMSVFTPHTVNGWAITLVRAMHAEVSRPSPSVPPVDEVPSSRPSHAEGRDLFDDSESDNDNQLEKTPLLSRLQTSAVVFSDSDDDSDSSTSDDNHGDDRQEVGIVELTQASIEGGQGVLLDVPPPAATVTLVENNSAGEDVLAAVGYVVGTSRLPIARVDVDFDTVETVREDPVGLGHLYKYFAPSMDQAAAVEALKACPPGSFLLRGNDDDDDVIVSYVAMQPSAEVGVMHAPLTESSDGSWSLPDKPSFTALAMLWRFCSDDFKFGYVGTADPPFLQALYIDDLPVAPQPLAIERGKSTPTPSVAPTPAPGGAITPNTIPDAFDADSVFVAGPSTGEVLFDQIPQVSIFKDVASTSEPPTAAASGSISSLLNSFSQEDFDAFTPSLNNTTEAVVAELALKDQQDMMRRKSKQGSGTLAAGPMSSIPEDAAAAIGEAMARSSVSFVLPTVQTTTGPQAPSLRTPTLRSVTHAVTAAMSMASGAGEGSLFLTSRVSAGVAVVGKVIDGKLTKRPSYEAVRRLLRSSQEPLHARLVGVVGQSTSEDEPAAAAAHSEGGTVVYEIDVSQGTKNWKVFSRYSELSALHDLLRHNCPSFKGAFPPKHSFLGEDSKFMEARRVGLGRWLDEVMQNPFTRCAYEVSTFLAPRSKVAHRSTLSSLLSIPVAITKGSSRKLVSMPGVGKSEGEDPVVASTPLMSPLLGFEDAIPALEPPSSATAPDTNPFSGVNAHAGTPFARSDAFAGVSGGAGGGRSMPKQYNLFNKEEQEIAESHITSLIHELFGMHSKAWWHRHFLGLVENLLRVMFHGVAARTLREKYDVMTSPLYISELMQMVQSALWPNGKWKQAAVAPSLEEQFDLQEKSFEAMLTVFNMLGTVVDADAGCNKLHGFLQYPPLVKSFAFTVMDMYLLRAFPGISVHGLPHAPK